MERQILLLGDPKLYEISEKVTPNWKSFVLFSQICLTALKAFAVIMALGGQLLPHKSGL